MVSYKVLKYDYSKEIRIICSAGRPFAALWGSCGDLGPGVVIHILEIKQEGRKL
jgi:hypothetical protein